MKQYFLYIMASKKNGTLYVGVISDIIKRVYEHKEGIIKGFTSQYDIKTLVYYEVFKDVEEAIKREKNVKAWKRDWKLKIIEEKNPDWLDLYDDITGSQPSLG